ncbi:MAG: response regulator transcription factor [Luteolibacter sp.]|uniref:response regulator transcription factor n=1 Tax=Luteolibacter sp. TaxID=1962973 RepID=UPI0032660462
MPKKPHTLAIVEDDASLRDILTEIVNGSSWKLVTVYSNAESALEGFAKSCPEVVLMDIQLPGMSGIQCVAKLKELHPSVLVLMVTVYDNSERIFDALAAGASGYLLKRDAPDKLLEALQDLLAGGSPMSSAIARKVVQHFHREPVSRNKDLNLTPRETQILELLAKGSLYKEIAWDLGIGFETVRSHIDNIYNKLHVRTRTEAVVKFLGPQ